MQDVAAAGPAHVAVSGGKLLVVFAEVIVGRPGVAASVTRLLPHLSNPTRAPRAAQLTFCRLTIRESSCGLECPCAG